MTSLSWLGIVQRHAVRSPDATAFTFLKDGENESSSLSFVDLHRHAQALAAQLAPHAARGERVILLFPSGLEFIKAFLGCLYAGIVPVPVSQPRRQQGMDKLAAIAANCDARLILTDTNSHTPLARNLDDVDALRSMKLLPVDLSEPPGIEAEGYLHDPDPDAIAFLQYTSGSTGTPKGVAITHANLLANQEMIRLGFRHDSDTVFVGWLPFHHDMGLVGNILQPLYLGIHCVLMPPTAFVQHPLRWLQAITKYRATTSGGPNFAYELCVRRVSDEQMASLDLRNWKIAFNGSEPVRAETLRRFSQKFAAAGFAPQAAFPCYGMAEATLFVSGPAASEAPALLDVSTTALENHRVVRVDTALPHTTLVGCGLGQLDQRIEIVHPDTLQACGSGDIGEIWLKGSHIARGYWNNPEASAECFGPRLAGTDDGGFFRTGDLGFIHQGDLFVTGRCKDLIIIAGRNLHPHDIEQQAAASHPLLQDCPSAAFSLDIDGAEKLVLVTETSTRRLSAADTQAVAMSVRKSIANHFDVALHQLVIVKPGGVPRTSSGKTQRQLCRQLHLRQSLPLITSDSPA